MPSRHRHRKNKKGCKIGAVKPLAYPDCPMSVEESARRAASYMALADEGKEFEWPPVVPFKIFVRPKSHAIWTPICDHCRLFRQGDPCAYCFYWGVLGFKTETEAKASPMTDEQSKASFEAFIQVDSQREWVWRETLLRNVDNASSSNDPRPKLWLKYTVRCRV